MDSISFNIIFTFVDFILKNLLKFRNFEYNFFNIRTKALEVKIILIDWFLMTTLYSEPLVYRLLSLFSPYFNRPWWPSLLTANSFSESSRVAPVSRDHGFETRWSPKYLSGFFTQFMAYNCVNNCDDQSSFQNHLCYFQRISRTDDGF